MHPTTCNAKKPNKKQKNKTKKTKKNRHNDSQYSSLDIVCILVLLSKMEIFWFWSRGSGLWVSYPTILNLFFYHFFFTFYTPPHNSDGVLWFHLGSPSVRLSIVCPSVRFLVPDDNLSKHQWIFTKLGMCIDIMEIWFGTANGQILSNFLWSYLPETCPYFCFQMIT